MSSRIQSPSIAARAGALWAVPLAAALALGCDAQPAAEPIVAQQSAFTDPPPDDPCATTKCPDGTHCEVENVQCFVAPCPPSVACVPNDTVVRCGGIAGIPCPGDDVCVDDPSDDCDPNAGGADCIGICQPRFACEATCARFCEFGNVLDADGCPTCQCNPPPTAED